MVSLRRALASGAFAARALYLDTLGHQLRCAARHPHFQYAVLKPGAYLPLLDVVGQNQASPEGTVATFPNEVAGALPLFLRPALAAYGQHPLVERYLHVLALDAGQFGPDEQVAVFVQDVERRGPLHRLGALLASAGAPHVAEHLVEQAVHLALRIVEPASPIRTHGHLLPTSFLAVGLHSCSIASLLP